MGSHIQGRLFVQSESDDEFEVSTMSVALFKVFLCCSGGEGERNKHLVPSETPSVPRAAEIFKKCALNRDFGVVMFSPWRWR